MLGVLETTTEELWMIGVRRLRYVWRIDPFDRIRRKNETRRGLLTYSKIKGRVFLRRSRAPWAQRPEPNGLPK